MINSSDNSLSSIKKKAKTVLYKQGDEGKHLYILKSGSVILYSQEIKEPTPVNVVNQGEFFGFEVLFQDDFENLKYNYTAIALEEIDYVRIEIDDIYDVVNTMPEWVNLVLGTLNKRLSETTKALIDHKLNLKYSLKNSNVSETRINEITNQLRS